MQSSVTEHRERYLGGSDIPIIMGLSPFKTRWELLQEKAGIKPIENVSNKYIMFGNKMEGKIRDYVNSTYGTNFVEGKHVKEGEIIGIRCHTDGEIENTILEIKTTSEIEGNMPIYEAQLCFYMMVTGKNHGLLAIYLRPEDLSEEFDSDRLHFVSYTLDVFKKKGLVDKIETCVEAFINDLVSIKINPNMKEQDFLPQELITVADQVIAFEKRMAEIKAIEKQIEAEKKKLYEAMLGTGTKSWRTPNGWLITRVDGIPATTETVEKFNEEKFKAENPDMYAEYVEQAEKKKSGRKGYVLTTPPSDGKKKKKKGDEE